MGIAVAIRLLNSVAEESEREVDPNANICYIVHTAAQCTWYYSECVAFIKGDHTPVA